MDADRLRDEFRKAQIARVYLDALKARVEIQIDAPWTNRSEDRLCIDAAQAMVEAEEAEQRAREAFIRATSRLG